MSTATSQVDRSLSQVMSIGWVVLLPGLVLGTGDIGLFAPWWRWGVLFIVGLVFVNATLGTVLSLRALKVIWVVIPVSSILALALLLSAYTGPDPEELVAWQMTTGAVFLCYLVFWMPVGGAIATAVVTSFVPALSSLVVLGPVLTGTVLYTLILLSHVGVVVFFFGVRRALLESNKTAKRARDARALQLRAVAEANEHDKFAAVVHDEVLSSLSAALRFEGVPPAPLRDSANVALAALQLLEHQAPGHLAISLTDTSSGLAQLEAQSRRLMPQAQFRVYQGEGMIPMAVADAITGAVVEALRNVRRHAGADANCVVAGRLSADEVFIDVSDDGRGFQVTEVPQDRMGLSHSLIARMRAVGGTASVVSRPGVGTTVVVQWKP